MQNIELDLVERAMVGGLRAKINALAGGGCICPTCDSVVKIYRRKLNSTMARQLINLYLRQKNTSDEWVDILTICLDTSVSGGDFAKLLHWGMIEQKQHESGEEGKKTSGQWRITSEGVSFVTGKLAVNTAVFLLFGEVVGWDDKQVTIRQCLGNHFNYNELMEAV